MECRPRGRQPGTRVIHGVARFWVFDDNGKAALDRKAAKTAVYHETPLCTLKLSAHQMNQSNLSRYFLVEIFNKSDKLSCCSLVTLIRILEIRPGISIFCTT